MAGAQPANRQVIPGIVSLGLVGPFPLLRKGPIFLLCARAAYQTTPIPLGLRAGLSVVTPGVMVSADCSAHSAILPRLASASGQVINAIFRTVLGRILLANFHGRCRARVHNFYSRPDRRGISRACQARFSE